MNDKDTIKCPHCGELIEVEYHIRLQGKRKRKYKENITNKMAQVKRVC